jgi:starch synthase
MFVVPSRYEPCGLVQMIAMRYGAVPIVHATGGLRDSVRDQAAGSGTGVVFREATVDSLAAALRRALGLYQDRRTWQAMQRRAARQDFSWNGPAKAYATLYRQTVRAYRARGA